MMRRFLRRLKSGFLNVMVGDVQSVRCKSEENCVLNMIINKHYPTVEDIGKPICNCFACDATRTKQN